MRVPVTMVAGALLAAAVCGQARSQQTTLRLDADLPCCAAGEHILGWTDASLTGADPTDMPEPPEPPSIHLQAGFRLPGAPESSLWRRDLRATADFTGDNRETWDLRLSTDGPPAICTVTIAAGEGLTGSLRVVLSGAVQDTVQVPASVGFLLSGSAWLAVEVVSEVLAAETMTWGGVKSLYD